MSCVLRNPECCMTQEISIYVYIYIYIIDLIFVIRNTPLLAVGKFKLRQSASVWRAWKIFKLLRQRGKAVTPRGSSSTPVTWDRTSQDASQQTGWHYILKIRNPDLNLHLPPILRCRSKMCCFFWEVFGRWHQKRLDMRLIWLNKLLHLEAK